ncbi:hypothetical protein CEB3_c17910 [Peptococcaceae bacterium CEB3]|nr:hypothetical protein CEB3_c17910 [Peptococcaceae bacterium CEB3]
MPTENFTLIETVSGKWVKAQKETERGTFAIELSESILLIIYVSSSCMTLHIKDEDDIYTYVGDQTLKSSQSSTLSIWLHTSRFEKVLLSREQFPIKESLKNVHDLTVLLTTKPEKENNMKILALSRDTDVRSEPTDP